MLIQGADAAAGPLDAAALRAQGVGSALEIGVQRIEFVGGEGTDPELALELHASARLVDTSTGAVDYERDFRTHLVSPAMAAAAAITGHFVDIRDWH